MLLSLHCIVPAVVQLHSFAKHRVDVGGMVSSKVPWSVCVDFHLFFLCPHGFLQSPQVFSYIFKIHASMWIF